MTPLPWGRRPREAVVLGRGCPRHGLQPHIRRHDTGEGDGLAHRRSEALGWAGRDCRCPNS
eukprot:5903848-Lingulodinium_polyedra.AAC.1